MNATSAAWRTRTGGPRQGLFRANGNGSTKVFTIPHGLGTAPTGTWFDPITNPDSRAPHTVTSDATNLTLTFTTAPPVGVNNVQLGWCVTGSPNVGIGYPV